MRRMPQVSGCPVRNSLTALHSSTIRRSSQYLLCHRVHVCPCMQALIPKQSLGLYSTIFHIVGMMDELRNEGIEPVSRHDSAPLSSYSCAPCEYEAESMLYEVMQNDGCYFPLPVITREKASIILDELYSWEASRQSDCEVVQQQQLTGDDRFDIHLLFPWAAALVRHPTLVNAVRDALGTNNILVWSSDINSKPPHSQKYVSPHQDSTYANLTPATGAVTAWVALTDAPVEAGCMTFAIGSHLLGQLPHKREDEDDMIVGENSMNDNNMLTFNQTIDGYDNEYKGRVEVGTLKAGEASLHYFHTVHWSTPNTTDYPRVGLAIRYVCADIRRCCEEEQNFKHHLTRESATLVSGIYDPSIGEFDLEPEPKISAGVNELRVHSDSLARQRMNYFASGGNNNNTVNSQGGYK